MRKLVFLLLLFFFLKELRAIEFRFETKMFQPSKSVLLINGVVKFKFKIRKSFKLGIGIEKEGAWRYDGYYLIMAISHMYKKLEIEIGTEYGIPSTEWNIKERKLVKNFYLPKTATSGKIAVLYPYICFHFSVLSSFSIGAGVRINEFKYFSHSKTKKIAPVPYIGIGFRI